MTYSHTQTGWLHWIVAGTSVPLCATAYALWGVPMAWIAPAVAAAICLLLSLCFRSLTVEDGGEALEVRYGPLPLFQKRIAYDRIVAVQAGRSALVDGLGVHWVPGRGWTYNLWGRTCAELTLEGGRRIRVGTDDPEGLVGFLRSRITG